jgi:predicted AlkP superfamily phosphohydrolase/phosphomutase/Flp pilus assembly protein TadD
MPGVFLPVPDPGMARPRVLLLGWDAADWKIITPLLERGEMPSLARLIREGVMGNIATLAPALSPLLWTSIATGKRADQHGILGFAEPKPDGTGLRLASSESRRCAALWNILAAYGKKSAFVHWFATHPAEPVPGAVIVSDLHPEVTAPTFDGWPLPPDCVQPQNLRDMMQNLRIHPNEISSDQFRALAPTAFQPDLEKDRRTAAATKALAHFGTTHAVGTWLAEHGDWDLLAVYYRAPDDLCHEFMEYRAPKRDHVSHPDHLRWGDVVDNTYKMLDASLGRYLNLVGPDTTVLIVSDHGFHSDHLRPAGTSGTGGPNPIEWHRDYGVFVARGPGLKCDERVYGASLLDVAPTVLALLGLPIARDFEGSALTAIFATSPPITWVPTFDRPEVFAPLAGGGPLDPRAEQAAMDQLIRLGYLPEMPADPREQVRGIQIERLRALAQVHFGAGRFAAALIRLVELRDMAPEDRHAIRMQAGCQIQLGRLSEAEALIAPWLTETTEDPGLALLAGRLRAAQGRDVEALAWLERARVGAGDRVQIFSSVASLHLARGRLAEAVAGFSEVLELDPENAGARAGLGIAWQRLGRNEEAAEQLMRSIALLHRQSHVHHHLGLALLALGHFQWAARAFTVSLGFNENNPEAHEKLAEIYTRLDQRAVAQEHAAAAPAWREHQAQA